MIDGNRRYPKYRDSGLTWLATIPSHWNEVPGIRVLREKQDRNIGMREKRVLSLSYGRVLVKPEDRLRGLVPESFETYQIVQPGDIIIRGTDLQNDMVSHRIGFVRDHGIITSAYLCLRSIGTFTHEYAYLVLHAYDVGKFLYGLGSGLRQSLSFRDFRRLLFPVPPLEEQRAIVRFLDYADRRIRKYIASKRKLIALLEEQKRAIIDRAVTRGLDPNVRLKDSGVPWIGMVPEHWTVRPLKAVAHIQSGVTLGKAYAETNLLEFQYLAVSNVQAGRTDLRSVKTLRLPQAEAVRSLLRRGDVLMTEGGDPDKLGRGTVWSGEIEPCLHQNHVFAVRPDLGLLLPEFLAQQLQAKFARDYFMLTAKQTTNLASTNKTAIGALSIPLPPRHEQSDILAAVLAETARIERLLGHSQSELDLLRDLRTRLVSDVVTGKLDVREAAASLPDDPKDVPNDDAGLLDDATEIDTPEEEDES